MQSKSFLFGVTAVALSLASGIAAAAVPQSSWIDSSAYEQRMPFESKRSAAEVRAEARAAQRLPSYIDGSAYEMAHAMFMSRKTRDEVRAEAANSPRPNSADLLVAHGGRN